MKVGIWGTGNIANTHAEALKGIGITIGAVVNRSYEKAKEFAERWGVEAYGIDPKILMNDGIEVVHVCTPPNLHYEMVKTLLNNGKHVLCEKPLCFENWQADELYKLSVEKKRLCAINFNVRYHVACQKAKQLIDSEDFGRVMLVHGNYLQQFNAFPASMDWRYDQKLAGRMRAVTEIGSHWVDIAQFLSGKKIEAVSALFGRFNPRRKLKDNVMYPMSNEDIAEEIEVISEDAAAINLRFEDGAIGNAVFSEVSQGRINYISLEVTGEKMNLWWNSESNNFLHTSVKEQGVNTEVFGFGNGFSDTFKSLVKLYYDSLENLEYSIEQLYPTFDDGANIVRICNAILESSDNDGKWVEID